MDENLAMLWTMPWNLKLLIFMMLAIKLPPPLNIIMMVGTGVLYGALFDSHTPLATIIFTLIMGSGVAWLWSAWLDRNLRRKEERSTG